MKSQVPLCLCYVVHLDLNMAFGGPNQYLVWGLPTSLAKRCSALSPLDGGEKLKLLNYLHFNCGHFAIVQGKV